jgi:16S rRNA (guanine527-N7)-methyltransferase
MERLQASALKLGLHLSSQKVEQFSIYYKKLVDWNQRINLTAITDYEEVQTKHFLDSLTVFLALKRPLSSANLRVIDIGTGAGLPGLPLKILLPDIKLVLLDSTAKKATFLHHMKEEIGLDDVEIIVGRAEEVAHQIKYREMFDIVLSRAVALLPTLVELTLPFCAIGGIFVAQKGKGVEQELSRAGKAIDLIGGKLREVRRVEMEEFTDERWLVIIDKISPTLPKYPRRPGIPGKRPLV